MHNYIAVYGCCWISPRLLMKMTWSVKRNSCHYRYRDSWKHWRQLTTYLMRRYQSSSPWNLMTFLRSMTFFRGCSWPRRHTETTSNSHDEVIVMFGSQCKLEQFVECVWMLSIICDDEEYKFDTIAVAHLWNGRGKTLFRGEQECLLSNSWSHAGDYICSW